MAATSFRRNPLIVDLDSPIVAVIFCFDGLYKIRRLTMRKRSTYIWLCAAGGWLGLHKFYIEEYGKGFLYMFTVGLFMFGWFRDLIHAGGDLDRYVAKRGNIRVIK